MNGKCFMPNSGRRWTLPLLFICSFALLLIYVSNVDRMDSNPLIHIRKNISFAYESRARSSQLTDALTPIDLNATIHILNMTHQSYIKELKNPCWFDPTGNLRCLPYFFLAGCPKSASTDLFRRITLHLEVMKPRVKEPHWWARHRFGYNLHPPVPFRGYMKTFNTIADFIEENLRHGNPFEYFDRLITGDGSMSTLWDNDVWPRLSENAGAEEPLFTNADYVHHVLPNAKIILILRNPADRLFSDYLFFQYKTKSAEIFHDQVTKAIDLYTQCFQKSSIRSCAYNATLSHRIGVRLRIGLYSVFIEDWLKSFPVEQLHVLRTEDYAETPLPELRRIFDFLELSPLDSDVEEEILRPEAANTRRKADKAIGNMLPDTRKMLSKFYRHFNENLSVLLNDSKYLWDD